MNQVAEIVLIVDAIILAVVAPLEMFFLDRPAVQKFLNVEPSNVRDAELWAFCIGARNLLASVGVVAGVWLLHGGGTEETGVVVMLVIAWYMLLSSVAMGVADALGKWHPRGGGWLDTLYSAPLPAVALVAQGFWG